MRRRAKVGVTMATFRPHAFWADIMKREIRFSGGEENLTEMLQQSYLGKYNVLRGDQGLEEVIKSEALGNDRYEKIWTVK